ncbi:hypothetical protein HK101_004717 [Irineochytrium annulatum]|nr:hypothetical protein HK101_004717 [Irineochytrium annulatum]
MNATDATGTAHLATLAQSSQVVSWVMLAGYAVGLPLNAILVAAYIKHRRELLVRTIDHLFLFVIFTHMSWAFVNAWIQAYVVLTLDGFAASPQGVQLCQAAGIMMVATVGNAITAHMLMSIDRWLIVVAGVRDSRLTVIVIGLCVELIFAGLAVGQSKDTERAFEPAESGLYCFFPFITRRDYADLTVTILASVYCALASTVILCAYSHIYFRAIRVCRPSTPLVEEDAPGTIPLKRAQLENLSKKYSSEVDTRRMFFRCLGVLAVFGGSYMLEFGNFAYRLATNKEVAGWVDGVAGMLSLVDTIATPVLIVAMNDKVQKAVEDAVGLKLSHWRRREGMEARRPEDAPLVAPC